RNSCRSSAKGTRRLQRNNAHADLIEKLNQFHNGIFSCYSLLKLTQNNYIKKSLKQTYVCSFRAINFLFMSKANIYYYKYFDFCHLYNIKKYYNDIRWGYMKEKWEQFKNQITSLWNNSSKIMKSIFIGVTVLLLAAIIFISIFTSKTKYVPLYSNLSIE